MIRLACKTAACATLLLAITAAARAASLAPLTSFGGGDGWLAPGDRTYLPPAPGDNNQRGLAYNPVTGHLLLVNRTGGLSINILDGTTGDDLGTLSGAGSLSGGTFAGNMIGVADDGAIYVANLTTDTTASPFKIYRWENESAAAPTVAFSGDPLAGARLGDSLDAIGSGANTRLVAGYAKNALLAGTNSFALFSTTDGLNFAGTHIDFSSTPPQSGDFRLGITFQDADTVMGSFTDYRLVRIADVAGSTGTLVSTFATEGAFLNPMDFAVVEEKPLLAVVNTADSRLFVYDITPPFDEVDPNPNIAVATTTTSHNTNLNATGQVKFGAISDNTAVLYALDTNNGIQAFTLTLEVGLDGDFNGDGSVDAADYVVWRANDGTQEGYDLWRANFGAMAGAGAGASAAVPEPSTLLLMSLAAAACLAMSRRRS